LVARLGITVVELPTFVADARRLLTEEELHQLIDRLAYDPEQGVLIRGTGGIRKTRVAIGGRGKRGGGRVIYFYYDPERPLFLLALYAKNEKTDLSEHEKIKWRGLVKQIVRSKPQRGHDK
jgi:hypothetical protein